LMVRAGADPQVRARLVPLAISGPDWPRHLL